MTNVRLIAPRPQECHQLRRELTDWLQCLAGGALWVALLWGAVRLHALVSGGL